MDESRNVEIVNLGMALNRLGGDQSLLEEVAQLFIETAPDLLEQVRLAVDTRNTAAVYRAAHTLKGSLGNFCAEPAFQAAYRLEQIGRSGEMASLDEAFASLEAELGRLQPALAALVGKPGV